MDGHIKELIRDDSETARDLKSGIFGDRFQRMPQWSRFLADVFDDNPMGLRNWLANERVDVYRGPRARAFQALYVGCWIHRPVEKGSMMIDLSEFSPTARNKIIDAVRKLPTRASSHLAGVQVSGRYGHSAGEDFKFIKDAGELLVQYEEANHENGDQLFLKMEGNKTGKKATKEEEEAHRDAWVVKNKTGEGKTFNEALHLFVASKANRRPDGGGPLIEPRAAENFSKGWLIVMEKAGIQPRGRELVSKVRGGKYDAADFPTNAWFRRTTIQDVLTKLNKMYRFPCCIGFDFHKASNASIALKVKGLLDYLSKRPDFFGTTNLHEFMGQPLKGDADPYNALELVRLKFLGDGEAHIERTYLENRMQPTDIERSLCYFFG